MDTTLPVIFTVCVCVYIYIYMNIYVEVVVYKVKGIEDLGFGDPKDM